MNLIFREKYIDKINNAFQFVPIVILIGARQVGKSSIMQMLKYDKSFFLNGDDIEIAEIFQKYSTIENYLKINLNKKLKGVVFIDEFQYINNISAMLKLLVDKNPDLKIIASGSSSLDILQKVEESLSGRVRVIEVYSLSFSEYIKFYDEGIFNKYKKYAINTDFEIIDKKIFILFKEYLTYGGLPRVALARKSSDKIELLDDIYKTYLLKDVRSYVRNQDSIAFNNLLKILSSQIGNLVNINEISNTVKLSNFKCEEYIYLLEQMYIIKLIAPYLTNKRKIISKMKKVFFLDLGLRNMIYNSFNDIDIRVDNGNIFENYVMLELFKKIEKSHTISFYRTKDGLEVDFILDNHFTKIPIEAKYKTFEKAQKIKNLTSFAELENLDKSYVVNINYYGNIRNTCYISGLLLDKFET